MKRFILKSILALAAIVSVAGCAKEAYNTDQYGDTPTLAAFAPNPVYRGGVLTFLGSHLDQVAEVQIPGVDAITDINVETSGAKSRISIVLPNTTEQVGNITLVTKSGAKLVSQTELTYTEPIVFDDFTPKNAMPGDVITVTGDYMNLVQEVIFGGNAYAIGEAITSQTRKELKVVVPDNAISGRFILGDSDELTTPDVVANKIYSGSELTVGDPKVISLGTIAPKAGDEITITGEYLSMIASATVSGVAVEPVIEAGSKHGVKAVVTIPETSGDGDIVLTSFAGKDFVAATVETVVPTDLAIAAKRFKAGVTATITGKDLDLVTGVTLGDAACDFTYDTEKKEITFAIPATAKDGAAVLSLANEKTVSTEEVELVKPVISEITPLEITAGDKFVISGDDLDLVTGVKLGKNDEDFELGENGKITVTTKVTSVAGSIVLSLANGVTVESEDQMAVKYDSYIVVNEMPEAEHIGAIVTLKGSNFLMIESILIGDAKVTKYIARKDDEIQFVMPFNKIGTYSITFNLTNGDSEVCPKKIEVLLEQYFINAWEGSTTITWGLGGRVCIPLSKFEGVSAGAKLRLYYTQKDQVWAQAQINNGKWKQITFPEVNGTLVPTDVYGWFSDGILDRITELTLTQEVLDNIKENADTYEEVTEVCGIIIQGSDLTFTKAEIVGEIAQEKTIWSGSFECSGWNGNQDLAWGAFDWSTLSAGQVLKFYMTPTVAEGDWWCISLRHGVSWGALPSPIPGQYDTPGELLDVELTQDILSDIIANNGLVVTGTGFILTKITVL